MSLQHTEKKPLPKAVEWQVQQLRLTVFTGEVASFSPEDWWVNLVGSPPYSVVARPKEGLFQQEGAFEGRKLLLRAQADRIDWLFTPAFPEQPEELLEFPPTAGPFPEALGIFQKLALAWFKIVVFPVNRLAFGAVLLQPVADREAGYARLDSYLHDVSVKPSTSDFFYQINRPRLSRTVHDLQINRLTKWSVALFQRFGVRLEPKVTPKTQITSHESACHLELDINTPPDLRSPIPRESVEAVFTELASLGEEIAAKGDVP